MDATIVRDGMAVTRMNEEGEYRKVHYHSDKEFELALKFELKRRLKKVKAEQKEKTNGVAAS